jgi:polysaccharide export outer membrane protein
MKLMDDKKTVTTMAALAAVLLLGSGCASSRVVEINGRLSSPDIVEKRNPQEEYKVAPPDVLKVEFLKEQNLTREVRIRQDGYITLPLVEDVEVVGLTTVKIRDKLESLYTEYHKDPQILVTVTGYNSKYVYVYGEVGRQGRVAYTGAQTVSGIIGTVGGVTRRAATSRVKVIRGDKDEPEVFKVDLDRLLLEGELLQDVSLAENDVVYVPPTVLAWIGYQIDALLFPFRGALSAVGTARAVSDSGD